MTIMTDDGGRVSPLPVEDAGDEYGQQQHGDDYQGGHHEGQQVLLQEVRMKKILVEVRIKQVLAKVRFKTNPGGSENKNKSWQK